MLVSFQLGLAVLGPSDDNLVQMEGIFQNMHPRIEAQLPLLVLHLLGHANLEFDIHLPVPLGYIPEPGFDYGGIDDIGRYHLTVFVFDGLHDYHLPTVIIVNDECVRAGNVIDRRVLCHAERSRSIFHQPDAGLQPLRLNLLEFAGTRAALRAEKHDDHNKEDGTYYHRKSGAGRYHEQFPVMFTHILPVIRALAILFVPGLYCLE